MSAKQTIAIVGTPGKKAIDIIHQLPQENYRWLVVLKDSEQLNQTLLQVAAKSGKPEIELLNCVKDSCWEADIIILAVQAQEIKGVLEKLRDVATQKIVVCISAGEEISFSQTSAYIIQGLLPYSKVISVSSDPAFTNIAVGGNDLEAVQTIENLIRAAGYHPTITGSLKPI